MEVEGKSTQVILGWDTFSMLGMIHPDQVPVDAVWVDRKQTPMTGVVEGAVQFCQGIVLINMRLTYGGAMREFMLKVVPPPKMVTILLGIPDMHALDAVPRIFSQRVFIGQGQEVVFTDFLKNIHKRMTQRPIRVLSVCDGSATPYIALMTAGYRIEQYRAVEIDMEVRGIARGNCPIIDHVAPHDVRKPEIMAAVFSDDFIPDFCFGSSKCTAFSRARRNPLGLEEPEEKGETGLFRSTARICREARRLNPHCAYFNETVVPHKKLEGEIGKLDALLNAKHQYSQATQVQAAARRPRMLATNMVTFSELPKIPHYNPLFVLRPGWCPSELPFPCLMSLGNQTHTNLTLTESGQYRPRVRTPTIDERERMMGYSVGVSKGFFKTADTTSELRVRVMGGALCMEQLWEAVTHWRCDIDVVCVVQKPVSITDCVSVAAADRFAVENWLTNLSDQELQKYAEESLAFWGPLKKCSLTVDKNQIPFQTQRKIIIQQPLQLPAEAKVESMIGAGLLREVPYSADLWIHDFLLLKKEPERIDVQTGLMAIRPVGILCAINSAHDYPAFMTEESPSVQKAKSQIPSEDDSFIISDAVDSYGAVDVEEDSQKFLGLGYHSAKQARYRMFVCPKMPQGLSTSGVMYPCWIHDIYNRIFGYHWRFWWVDHVDDTMCHAKGSDRAWARYRLMMAAQNAAGIRQSPKLIPSCRPSHIYVGLTWQRGLLRASDNVRHTLRIACAMRPTTAKQVRSVEGLVKASALALNYSIFDIGKLGEIYEVWRNAIDGKKAHWSPECIQGQDDILSHEGEVDWIYWDPDNVISETNSALILTDKSKIQLGISLYTVQKRNAETIVIEDLSNREITGLLDLSVRKLSAAEQRYHTAEGELLGGVVACKKYGKFLTACSANYDPAGRKCIAIATDSTPAKGKWKIFKMPHISNIDYLTAKSQRLFGWVDDISFTRYWPMALLHFAGESIILVDWISRTAEWFLTESKLRRGETKVQHTADTPLTERPDWVDANPTTRDCTGLEEIDAAEAAKEWDKMQREKEDSSVYGSSRRDMDFMCAALCGHQNDADVGDQIDTCCHISSHSYEENPVQQRPVPLDLSLLNLTVEQWGRLGSLQTEDGSTINGVKMLDVRRVLLNQHTDGLTSRADIDTVRAWKRSGRFVMVKEKGWEQPVLFTQATLQRVRDEADITSLMVPVIPPGLKVKLIDADHLYDQDETTPGYLRSDLRQELLLLTHEFSDHMFASDMVRRIREVAFWPSLKQDCISHVKACRRCLQLMAVLRNAGTSIVTYGRFKHMKLDVWKLPQSLVKSTGCYGVLSMVDAAGSMTRFASVTTDSAKASAYAIVRSWISVFGLMEIISSDNAPAYAGEVFRKLCVLFGIKHDFAALHDSRHMGQVETKHNPLKHTIMNALSKGDISNREDLELFLAFCEIRVNQLHVGDDLKTIFELYMGQPPRTVIDLIQKGDLEAIKLPIKKDDADKGMAFLGKLKFHVGELVAAKVDRDLKERQMHKEQRSRQSVLHRDRQNDAKQVTKFDLKPGDEVSFGKGKAVIMQLRGHVPDCPITANIRLKDGTWKTARMDEIRPLGSHRVQYTIPRDWKLQVGDFVFYDEDGGNYAGKITSVTTDGFTVHDWAPGTKSSKYLPLWRNPTSTSEPQRGPLKQPKGMVAHTTMLQHTNPPLGVEVVMVGTDVQESAPMFKSRHRCSRGTRV